MKNNISFYNHDVGSHTHPKFKTLRAKFGWEGEGRFWALNNLAGLAENCLLDISKKYNKGTLAVDLGMTLQEFEEFVDYLVNVCELFRLENGCLTNDTLQITLETVMISREKARERKEGSGKKSSPELRKSSPELPKNTKPQKSSQELSKSSPELGQSSGELNNNRIEENKIEEKRIDNDSPSLFEEFWTAYPNKRSRDRAENEWLNQRIDEELFQVIMDALEMHKKSRQWKDSAFIPFAHNWLRQRRYYDEVEPEAKAEEEFRYDNPINPCHIIDLESY